MPQPLEECYAQTARPAQQAGFDGAYIKQAPPVFPSAVSCSLLYNRPGQLRRQHENRTRFLLNAVTLQSLLSQGDFLVTSRLNIYDGFPYPYGFGVAPRAG